MTSNQTNNLLVADMSLNYPDGTGESVLFGITYSFAPGGLNMSTDQVLNWSMISDAGFSMNTWGNANGTAVSTLYSFMGFDIVNGSADNFNLTRTNGPNDSYFYSINDIIGSLNYANSSSITIGQVSLSSLNVSSGGQTLAESIAKFNVTFDAQLSDLPLPPVPMGYQNFSSSSVPVPVVMMFQITHDTAQTEIKYGLDVNWSAVQAFPTASYTPNNPNPPVLGALMTGDNFSLVAQDRLDFSYGGSSNSVATFSSDAQNDSAIYVVNGTELCRELFPTNYTDLSSGLLYNTTRDYLPISWQSTWNQSSMFVVIGGFKYNDSSGFSFDPAVIMPNSVTSQPGPSPGSSQTMSTAASSTMASSNTESSSNSVQAKSSFDPIVIIVPAVAILVVAAGVAIFLKRRKA